VASRILPVRIHDLDADDKHIVEKEIGGALRAIDFIYRELGVNRPLRVNEENPNNNQNQTYYRNQVNKLANSTKEIIYRLKSRATDPVVNENAKQESKATVRRPGFGTTCKIIAVLLIALVTAGLLWYSDKGGTAAPEADKSIAVLPFVNMSGDPEQEYFSDGLSEELLNLLAKIPELKVIARTSSFSFKGKNEDVRIIGEKLGVAYVLEGSVRKSGNHIRITTQLIKAENGAHLWSDTYDRELKDVFSIQDEISAKVVRQLRVTIPGLGNATHEPNIEAYNLMMEAMHVRRQHLPGNRERSVSLMKRAIAIDSLDAALWAGLAETYLSWDGNSVVRNDNLSLALAAVQKSIQLNDQLAEGHIQLARIYMDSWEWEKAKVEAKEAETLSQQPHNISGEILSTFGEHSEAISIAKYMLGQDPLNPNAWRDVGAAYFYADSIDEAIPYFEKAIELSPTYDNTRSFLSHAYAHKSRFSEAIAQLDKFQNKSATGYLRGYDHTYWLAGDTIKANQYFNQMLSEDHKPIDQSYGIMQGYAQRGNADLCFKWLDIAYERKSPILSLIKTSLYKNHIKDLDVTRYNAFVRKMNLPVD
jgi:TolB-like protein/cytochrome c-type biogenesis protein CcmH/NrfG